MYCRLLLKLILRDKAVWICTLVLAAAFSVPIAFNSPIYGPFFMKQGMQSFVDAFNTRAPQPAAQTYLQSSKMTRSLQDTRTPPLPLKPTPPFSILPRATTRSWAKASNPGPSWETERPMTQRSHIAVP